MFRTALLVTSNQERGKNNHNDEMMNGKKIRCMRKTRHSLSGLSYTTAKE